MSGQLAVIFGIVVICVVVFLIIKQYETRMVLIGAGFLMAIAALQPLMAFDAFSKNMVVAGLIQNICSALGFAAVLQLTKCDKHLVHALASGLKYVRPLLIPAAALATYLVNIAIPSAAGCAAAVGVVMIPLLVSQGVHPAVAASAVMLGTFGSTLSPGFSHNAVVIKLASESLGTEFTSIEFIKTIAVGSIPAFVIGAVSLTFVAIFRKENKGYVLSAEDGGENASEAASFKINPLFAILPLLPIVVLIAFSLLGSNLKEQTSSLKMNNDELAVVANDLKPNLADMQAQLAQKEAALTAKLSTTEVAADKKKLEGSIATLVSAQKKLGDLAETIGEQKLLSIVSFFKSWGWTQKIIVPHVMLLGAFLCLLFTRTSPTQATKDFFNGMGKGYGDVIGIIIAAGVFVGGMNALGLITAATDALKGAQTVAGVAATFGPFLIAVISGSGDAAAIAFNNSVTAHAPDFGFKVADMGALAALTGSLGRTMSPIAGAAILLAGLAKVNPFEIAKRNAPGMIVATLVSMFLMLYL